MIGDKESLLLGLDEIVGLHETNLPRYSNTNYFIVIITGILHMS